MRIAILGARGYLGRHLVTFLRRMGVEVFPFSSQTEGNIDPRTGVLSDAFLLPEAIDTIVYLAQSPFYHNVLENFSHVINVNVSSAVKVAECARKKRVQRLIYASTGNVYTPSFGPISEATPLKKRNGYIMSKVWAEEALSLFRDDFQLILLRPFGIYGPGQTNKLIPNLLDSIFQGREIYLERNPQNSSDHGGLRISLCYIDDAVKMLSQLITQGGPPYLNIAGDRAVSIREMVTLMSEYLKRDCRVSLSEKYRQSDLIADISLLTETLKPRFTSLEDGLRATVDERLNRSAE